MTFQLDTSGVVPMVGLEPKVTWGDADDRLSWSDLSPFTQGYVEALLRDLWDANPTRDGQALQAQCLAFTDLAPETLARIIADCERCEEGYRKLGIQNVHVWSGYNVWLLQQAGTLVEHGTPPLTVRLGDDGKVRFAP